MEVWTPLLAIVRRFPPLGIQTQRIERTKCATGRLIKTRLSGRNLPAVTYGLPSVTPTSRAIRSMKRCERSLPAI
jgi:hypothetical protein